MLSKSPALLIVTRDPSRAAALTALLGEVGYVGHVTDCPKALRARLAEDDHAFTLLDGPSLGEGWPRFMAELGPLGVARAALLTHASSLTPSHADPRVDVTLPADLSDPTLVPRLQAALYLHGLEAAPRYCAAGALGPEGRLTWVNEAWIELVGRRDAQEVLGRPFHELLPPVSAAQLKLRFEAFKGKGERCDEAFEITGPDGAPRWVSLEARAVRDDEGALLATRCVLSRLTPPPLGEEQRRLVSQAFVRPYAAFLAGLVALFILVVSLVHVVSFERFFEDHLALLEAQALEAERAQLKQIVDEIHRETAADLEWALFHFFPKRPDLALFEARTIHHLDTWGEADAPASITILRHGDAPPPRFGPGGCAPPPDGGFKACPTPEGRARLLYTRAFPGLGWRIVGEQRARDLEGTLSGYKATLHETLKAHLLVFVYVAVLALLFVTFGTLWLIRRLHTLISVYTTKLSAHRGVISEINAHLEEAVAARTRDILAQDAHARHLSGVLRVLRDISKLTAREPDPGRLIKETCARLVEAPTYEGAWILLGEGGVRPRLAASADAEGARLREGAEAEEAHWTLCATEAMDTPGVRLERPGEARCARCGFGEAREGKAILVCGLRHHQRILGAIGVTLPPELAEEAEQRALFGELAEELASALWRLEREQGRRALEVQHSAILEVTSDAIIVGDHARRIALFNPAAERLLGYSAAEVIGQPISILNASEALPIEREVISKISAHEPIERFEVELLAADGARKLVEVTLNVCWRGDRLENVVAIMRDVSARKATERALKESEAHFRGLVEHNHAVMLIIDPDDGQILEANPAAARFYGYPQEALKALKITDINQGTSPQVRGDMRRAITQSQTHFQFKHRLADGTLRDVEIHTGPVPYRGRMALHSIIHDVTERTEALEALQRSQRLISLNNHVSQVFLSRPPAEAYHEICKALLEALDSKQAYFGTVQHDGRWLAEWMCGDREWNCGLTDEGPRDGIWSSAVEARAARFTNAPIEGPDGAQLHGALAAPLVHQGEIVGLLGACDKPGGYTEADLRLAESVATQLAPRVFGRAERAQQREARKELEARLRQAQRMEAIGQLAGGVAHDFNNILQAMCGYGELLLLGLEGDPENLELAEEVQRGTTRAAALTRQLLAFSRRQVLEKRDLEFNELIRQLLRMLERLLGEDIELRLDLLPEALPLHADAGQLEQVIVNLCVNARDAMPDGGALLLQTRRCVFDESSSPPCGNAPGVYARLTIRDSGVGMEPTVQSQIFEPFFTTKEAGKGTGLGLSTVYGIIKQHEGAIHVQSAPELGTTFQISLPLITSIQPQAQPTPVAPREGGQELILFAEDDEGVRRLTQRILLGAGYRVLTAADGEEAEALIERHHAEIDLVLTDVVMPRKGAKEVINAFRRLQPRGRVLLMSGYTANTLSEEVLASERLAFLQKPFEPDLLLTRLRELLDS